MRPTKTRRLFRQVFLRGEVSSLTAWAQDGVVRGNPSMVGTRLAFALMDRVVRKKVSERLWPGPRDVGSHDEVCLG